MSDRQRLPDRHHSWTQKSRVGDQTIFLTCGEYENGTLGSVFMDCSKTGSAFRAILSTLAQTMSVGLQYGVPLEEYITILEGQQFFPAGIVSGSTEVSHSLSLLDYVAKQLKEVYLKEKEVSHDSQ